MIGTQGCRRICGVISRIFQANIPEKIENRKHDRLKGVILPYALHSYSASAFVFLTPSSELAIELQ